MNEFYCIAEVPNEYFSINFTKHNNGSVKDELCEGQQLFSVSIVVAILITLCAHILATVKCTTSASAWFKLRQWFDFKIFSRIIGLIIFILVLPLAVVSVLLALLYKAVCSMLIKRKDKSFIGFLDSFDVFWCLEEDVSKNTIDVVGFLESNSGPEDIVKDIKDKLSELLSNKQAEKLFYRRNEAYGFYYWTQYEEVDLDQYVEVVDLQKDADKINVTQLEDMMTEIWNQSLPYKDEGLFKVIITKQSVNKYGNQEEYGLVLRIHHSIGDGVALIEFLCNTIADKDSSSPSKLFSIPASKKSESPNDLLDMMRKLCKIPICLIDGCLRKPDYNILHGPPLIGKKIFKWTESDKNLLLLIQQIKDNVKDIKLSDLLATALASGLQKYFSKTMKHMPEDVAVVLPVKFPKKINNTGNLKLENDFSVAILDLPTKGDYNMIEIKSRCDNIRKSAEPLSNYYMIKLFCSVFPKNIIESILYSDRATLVFSNIPGPDHTLNVCGGNILKNLVFFIPHKGTTGLGVTALTYGGVLRFAAVADAALVSSSKELTLILDGMVDEIKRLHEQYVSQ